MRLHNFGTDEFGAIVEEEDLQGVELVSQGVLDATIQCSGIGATIFQTALQVLEGQEVEKEIIIQPQLVTRDGL